MHYAYTTSYELTAISTMTKNILLIFSFCLLIFSCQKDDEPSIIIKDSEINISNIGDSQTISFDASMNWTAKSSATWCAISPASGDASIKSLDITVATNETHDARSCIITISIGALTKTIKVIQAQEDAIILSEKTLKISSESQTLEVELKTNVDFEVIIPENAKNWISHSDTRSLKPETLRLNITENKDSDAVRSTEVYIKNKATSLQDTLTIIQEANPVATPVINPSGGIYTTAQTITITCDTDGAEIRYTLDGSEPIETSELYNGEFFLDEVTTIKAKAFKEDRIESQTVTETFKVNLGALIIEGSTNTIQHIDAPKDFIFRLNDLDDKDVFFVFSNQNTNNSTPLPQLQSDVETISKAVRYTSFSEPTFIVSGKPSITDFNNNPYKQPTVEKGRPQYQQHLASKPEKLMLGSSEILYDDLGEPQISTVRKVISANGKNLYVWVADNCWGSSSDKKHIVTQEMVDAFAPKFLDDGADNDIYDWVTNAIGEPWGNTGYKELIPETDDIHIWLTDIDDDNKTSGTITLGYYFSRDNFLKHRYSKSNEKLLFTIDAVLFAKPANGPWNITDYWPQQMISTLAHEFTHMIYFYQNNVLNNQEGNTAINEMSAQCVEDLVANKIHADGPRGVQYATFGSGESANSNGRLPLYNSYNDYNLLNWSSNKDEVLVNYSKTYALGAYLMRNYGGGKFLRELIQNKATGVNSIVAAVNANGGAVQNFGDVLQRFGAANLLSDNNRPTAKYRFNAEAWSTSILNGTTYELGSINLFNYTPSPKIYTEIPTTQDPNSNIYYKAGSNLIGQKEWSFRDMNPNTKLTVVIK